MMRPSLIIVIVVLALSGCALTPPKPSLWQLAGQCSETYPMAQIESCTKSSLDTNYGDEWQGVPQVDQFLDFIGATAQRVDAGAMTDADGRLAISTYASREVAREQAIQTDQQAQQQAANIALGSALMEASGPSQQPMTTAQRIGLALQNAQQTEMPSPQPSQPQPNQTIILTQPSTRAPPPQLPTTTFTPLQTQKVQSPIQCLSTAAGGQIMTNCTGGN